MLAKQTRKIILSSFVAMSTVYIAGCTYNPNNSQDPYESYNRKVFKFNMAVDKAVYRPIAKAYDTVTPSPIHRGINNFFNNLDEIPTVANDLLQANFKQALADTGRFVANTVFGVAGLYDAASTLGLQKHYQDFGLTMAKWGVRQSPYFLLPFIGPGTARDQFSFLVNYQLFTVYPYIQPDSVSYSLYGLNLINQRAALLPADKLIDQAFDPYIFVRDAYLQKRNAEINQVLNKQNSAEQQIALEAAEVSNTPVIGPSVSINAQQAASAKTVGDNANSEASATVTAKPVNHKHNAHKQIK